MNCLFGTMARASGKIELNGHDISTRGPVESVKNGMAYITESRRQTGYMPNFSIKTNIAVSRSIKIAPWRGLWGLIRDREESIIAEEQRKILQIKCASIEQNITELSGGNQQKVLVGKWMCTEPGHRCGSKIGNLQNHAGSIQCRKGDHHGFFRTAGNPGRLRPDSCFPYRHYCGHPRRRHCDRRTDSELSDRRKEG